MLGGIQRINTKKLSRFQKTAMAAAKFSRSLSAIGRIVHALVEKTNHVLSCGCSAQQNEPTLMHGLVAVSTASPAVSELAADLRTSL